MVRRGEEKVCAQSRRRTREVLCDRPSLRLPDTDGSLRLPPVSILLVVRCNREQVKGGCHTEDPNGSKGRRTLLNEVEIVQRLMTVSPGTTVKAANPGRLPLAEQVALMQRTDVLVGASGSSFIGMFFFPSMLSSSRCTAFKVTHDQIRRGMSSVMLLASLFCATGALLARARI